MYFKTGLFKIKKTTRNYMHINVLPSPCSPTENSQYSSFKTGFEQRSTSAYTNLFILRSFHQMVITETRRVSTTWIVNGEVTDRSALSDELADFCAQYPIYRVKEAKESLEVTGIQTGGEALWLD